MWQILNTSSKSSVSHPFGHLKVSPTGSLIQSRVWKYGQVFISEDIENLITMNMQNSVLLTTEPFDTEVVSKKEIKDRVIVVESQQENKCMETVQQVCQKLIEKGVNKESTIYIKGGGLLLDLGGFVSSIYMRGVKKVVYVPTTLLAIVDATVGGKNGVNWGGAKNMLGTISHAQEIRISLGFLDTLTDRQFFNGLAEVIKMAITHDEDLFELLEDQNLTPHRLRTDKQILRKVIKRSLDIKIKVVENDQFDRQERKWLNFGHTIGHALQMSDAGQKLKHGECVSIGMMQQLKLGEQLKYVKDRNLVKRVEKVLKKFNLPTKIPANINTKELIELMTKDKKNTMVNKIQFALVEKIGLRLQKTVSIPIEKLEQNYCQSVQVTVLDSRRLSIKSDIEKAYMKWQSERRFPSSKSLSIRYLFLSALSFKKNRQNVKINNFLQSEDTFHLIECLKALGFGIQFNEQTRQLDINDYKQVNSGKLNVGNSGLTARFILPLCAHLPGEWTIQCHPRMSERPNQQIFNFCKKHYDCQFQWTNNRQSCFPVKLRTKGLLKTTLYKPIELSSQQSSQFISSVLLNSYQWNIRKIELRVPSGKLVSQSYILMTIDCLNNFGASIIIEKDEGSKKYSSIVVSIIPIFVVSEVNIEQDLSSFSYPYALSMIHSAKATYPSQSVQGDKQFYQYCKSLTSKNLAQSLDFSQCTDTFMTMAAILATNTGNRYGIPYKNIQISGISNQRVKQSNRIKLTRQNLQKIGYNIQQTDDGLIFPIGELKYRDFNEGETVLFETAGDHRLAMSMGILSTYLSLDQKVREKNVKFVIDDKNAVKKTFPEFWNYLADVGVGLRYHSTGKEQRAILKPAVQTKLSRTLLMGNRGSGKTAIARMLCEKKNNTMMIDIDEEITKTIIQQHQPLKSIADFVQNKGWQQFRKLEFQQIQKYAYSNFLENCQNKYKNIIISLGGGVVDYQPSINALAHNNKRKQPNKIYIQRRLEDLQIVLNDKRPFIPNFAQVNRTRSKKYEDICDHIITIPSMGQPNQYTYKKINEFVLSEYGRIFGQIQLQEGFVYCIPKIIDENGGIIDWANDLEMREIDTQVDSQKMEENIQLSGRVSGVELRVDSMIHQILSTTKNQEDESQIIRKLRHSIANFKLVNHSLIKSLSTILTLRTKQEYGLFPDDTAIYQKWLQFLHKIPTSYIDYQLKYLNSSKTDSDHTNYIYSYHGGSMKMINRLLEMHEKIRQEQRRDLVKVCYMGQEQIWNRYHQRWRKSSDICVNLKNPLTRLDNKFKMVIRENDCSKIIRIPTRKELSLISRVSKYFL